MNSILEAGYNTTLQNKIAVYERNSEMLILDGNHRITALKKKYCFFIYLILKHILTKINLVNQNMEVNIILLKEEDAKLSDIDMIHFAIMSNRVSSTVKREGYIDTLSYMIQQIKNNEKNNVFFLFSFLMQFY